MALKRVLIVAAAVVVAAFVGWRIFLIVRPPSAAAAGVASGPANGARRAAPVAVEVADVSRATLSDSAAFSGVLESRSRLVITSKVAGRLERIPVRVGDTIRRGDLLAELDDEEYRQQLEQARAEGEVARANVETARIGVEAAARELERVQALQGKQIASASELDGAETQAKRAEVALTVAEAQLRQKEVAFATAELRVQ
jgi:multidrug efflux pump subunit AcrA (membrane-fusion protein)